jgi:hypothetical protein
VQPVRVWRGCCVHWLDAGDNQWRGARDVLRDSASRRGGRCQRHRDGNAPLHRRHIRVFRLRGGDVSYFNSNTDANANRYSNCHSDSYSGRDTNCHSNSESNYDTNGNGNSNSHSNSHCDSNSNPHRNTDGYCYAYSTAYRNAETSFYAAASRNTEAKTLVVLRRGSGWRLAKNGWLLASNAEPPSCRYFMLCA